MFKALLLEKDDAGFRAGLISLDESRLPGWEHADVLVQPEYSTVNYKDALALTNKGPVVRAWPMVPGIDGAGTVLESRHPGWQPGDRFVHNGWGVGETHWGCLAERARLKGDWLVKLPAAFTPRQAMAIGTAGYTAMLCVLALEGHGLRPGDGDVLVTGATGGVGSVAIALLSRLGHRVTAASGKPQEADYLKALGAAAVIDRAELAAPGKPLQKERWAGVVDALGSHTLANALAQTRYERGAVHPARRHTGRRGQRDGTPRPPPGGLGPPGARPRPGLAGAHDERGAAGRGARGGRAADFGSDARALRGAHRLTPAHEP